MVAVSKGFIDIVTLLHVCPLIDINHQDNDGNTALMIAAQAGVCGGGGCVTERLIWIRGMYLHLVWVFFNSGYINILNYIINFYSDVDTEVRDPRGFTALIKAGLQGREECVAALLMHGKQEQLRSIVIKKGKKWKETHELMRLLYSYAFWLVHLEIGCNLRANPKSSDLLRTV